MCGFLVNATHGVLAQTLVLADKTPVATIALLLYVNGLLFRINALG